eukprot:15457890-Alexandrium_andersonii.AAC.1
MAGPRERARCGVTRGPGAVVGPWPACDQRRHTDAGAINAGARTMGSYAPAPIPSINYLVKTGPGLKIQPGSS